MTNDMKKVFNIISHDHQLNACYYRLTSTYTLTDLAYTFPAICGGTIISAECGVQLSDPLDRFLFGFRLDDVARSAGFSSNTWYLDDAILNRPV